MGTPHPRRPNHFDRDFIRTMMRRDAGSAIGADGFALLTVIVTREDKDRYAGPVPFWVRDLTMTLGISEDTLARIRRRCVQAGWLHYEPGAKGRAAKYRVKIPGEIHPQVAGESPENPRDTTPQVAGESGGESPENPRDILTSSVPDPKTHTQNREVCVDSHGQKTPAEAMAEALAEVCGFKPTVKSAKDEFEKVVSELVAAGVTPEKVREFGKRFWDVCRHARRHERAKPTPREVANWIDRMPESTKHANGKPPRKLPPETANDTDPSALQLIRKHAAEIGAGKP